MDVDLNTPPMSVTNGDDIGADPNKVEMRDADSRILLRRPKSPLELAVDVHGPVHQTADWLVHPFCANPPPHSGACTYRFADGMCWYFKCQVAWTS
jgi:hypothetical protein